MEKTIKEMIESADTDKNYELAEFVNQLLSNMASTINCPSNWRELGEQLAHQYNENDWVMEYCHLYDFME